ncbi:MAG: hypothetical protein MUC50_18985 [Myxococcota bacterium]|jgi:hypothetical protein|nr:hypothetical protein [Myxococcota bacterium]
MPRANEHEIVAKEQARGIPHLLVDSLHFRGVRPMAHALGEQREDVTLIGIALALATRRRSTAL